MKRIMLAIVVMALGRVYTEASPYFRMVGEGNYQQSAGFLYDPNHAGNTAGVTDLAIITHSTKDGTIIPEAWRSYIPPEDWSPLACGGGGNFHNQVVINCNASVNVAPQVSALILGWVSPGSPPWLKAVQAALMGSGNGRVRLGWAEAGTVIKEGHFQSMKAAFPGQGLFDILGQAGRVEVAAAWTW